MTPAIKGKRRKKERKGKERRERRGKKEKEERERERKKKEGKKEKKKRKRKEKEKKERKKEREGEEREERGGRKEREKRGGKRKRREEGGDGECVMDGGGQVATHVVTWRGRGGCSDPTNARRTAKCCDPWEGGGVGALTASRHYTVHQGVYLTSAVGAVAHHVRQLHIVSHQVHIRMTES